MKLGLAMLFHNILKGISFLLAISLMAACSNEQSGSKRHKKSEHLVETAPAVIQQVSIQKTLPGTLEAVRRVKIFNQVDGLITTLPFYPGDQVEKGSILAKLDDALITTDLNKARASLKQAKLDLKRLKDLLPRKLASDDEVAKSKTAVDIAQAELNHHTTKLAQTIIKASFNGTISERLVEPGDVIPLHKHMMSLIDNRSLIVKIYISELLLPLIQKNDPVKIKIDALGDQQFNGQVIRTHPTIDENTRRGIIEVELNPTPTDALPGQLSRVTLQTISKTRLMVPFDAVRHDNDGAYVYAVIENKSKRIAIRTGIQSSEEIEILDGLNENDNIVTRGFFGLKNNQTVNIK
jgi:RND family efflux transporter MFP subunit